MREGDKAIGGEVRAVEVSAGEGYTGDVEVAGDADGGREEVMVEDEEEGIGDRAADRGVSGVMGGAEGEGGADGSFGRAVGVTEGAVSSPAGDEVSGAGFAGGDDSA